MSRPRVLAFSSAKGGSGKTVLCVSFGMVLAALHQRVLLVDADADTSGMTLLLLDDVLREKDVILDAEEAADAHIGGLFDDDRTLRPWPTPIADRLSVVPTRYQLTASDYEADALTGRLEELITEQHESFDYILIDAQAGGDARALAAATVADDVVIVSEYDPVSAQGVKRLEQLYPKIFSPDRTWILYNKVLPELAEAVGTFLRVQRNLSPVPWDADVVRAYIRGEVAIDMAIPNPYTLAVVESVETLFRRRIGPKVTAWREATAGALRAPIDQQLARIESELDDVEAQRIAIRMSLTTRRQRWLATVGVLVVGAVGSLVANLTEPGELTEVILSVSFTICLILTVALVMFERLPGPSRSKGAPGVELARLDRRYVSLDEERRRLAVSAKATDSTLGLGHN